MEAWKVLLLVAVLPTIASIVLSASNRATLLEAAATRDREKTKVEDSKKALETAKGELAKLEADTKGLQQDAELMASDLVTGKLGISEQDLMIQTLTDEIATADTQIAKFDELKVLFQQIDSVQQKITAANEEVASLQSDVTRAQTSLDSANARKQESEVQIERMDAIAKYRKTGAIWSDIDTRVKSAYNDWGFVIIGAGDAQGLVPAATLDVTRQGKPICKLLVTEVEVNQATADIIPATLLPGQTVQVGDTVTKKATVALP
jgi:archaellum component FlaC